MLLFYWFVPHEYLFSAYCIWNRLFFLLSGISSGQTNSDIEALHQAYRHVEQSLGATDEQNVHDEKIEVEGSLVNDTSQNKESCPQNTSITNSGKFWYFPILFAFIIPITGPCSQPRSPSEDDINTVNTKVSIAIAYSALSLMTSLFAPEKVQNPPLWIVIPHDCIMLLISKIVLMKLITWFFPIKSILFLERLGNWLDGKEICVIDSDSCMWSFIIQVQGQYYGVSPAF